MSNPDQLFVTKESGSADKISTIAIGSVVITLLLIAGIKSCAPTIDEITEEFIEDRYLTREY